LFSLPLAQQFKNVTAVEAGASAVRDLEFNAERAGISIEVRLAKVEQYLASLEKPPDFVLADPPRAGLGKAVTGHLARLLPERITLVSCDPSTLARDLSSLADYRIEKLTLVDFFPQTFHLETVVRLRRM